MAHPRQPCAAARGSHIPKRPGLGPLPSFGPAMAHVLRNPGPAFCLVGLTGSFALGAFSVPVCHAPRVCVCVCVCCCLAKEQSCGQTPTQGSGVDYVGSV